MEELTRLFPTLLNELGENDEALEALVFATWRTSVGKALEGRTVPMRFSDKRLTVAVPDETWKMHLESLAPQMLFRLNSSFKSEVVKFIEFKADSAAFLGSEKSETETAAFREASMAEISEELARAAEKIGDESLRESFLLAAGGCLVRNKES